MEILWFVEEMIISLIYKRLNKDKKKSRLKTSTNQQGLNTIVRHLIIFSPIIYTRCLSCFEWVEKSFVIIINNSSISFFRLDV